MSSEHIKQEAIIKIAVQTEQLVKAVTELNRQMEIQHKDNAKTQKRMEWATIAMAVASVIALLT